MENEKFKAPDKSVNTLEEGPLSRQEQLQRDLFYANRCHAVYWAQTKFKWSPRLYQVLLLGCLDRVYRYPMDYGEKRLRGTVVSRFAWRIGRQSGKTECLALAALYLSICKPIKYEIKYGVRKKANITPQNPSGMTIITEKKTRGAEIIMASADADKAKTVFERVLKFLESCDEYKLAMDEGAIVVKKHPYPQIEFFIGDWTTPARVAFRGPGASGQAARSKTYDYKLYDEADYMPEAFFAAELATEINAGENALVILSSTPSGRRLNFYKACFGFDTLVAMGDASLRQIKNIDIGDVIMDRYGKPAPVSDIMEREYEGTLVRMKVSGPFESFRVTPNHKIMSVRQAEHFCEGCREMVWMRASPCVLHGTHEWRTRKFKAAYHEVSNLRAGDYVAIPRDLAEHHFGYDNYSKIDNSQQLRKNKDGTTSFWTSKYVYMPITNYDVLNNQKTIVYNLTVDGDNSYTANGIGVSNCTDSGMGYKEFWFPSWENPMYDENMDRKMRAQLNTTEYEHEIMADWGTVEQGVFDWTYFSKAFSHKYKNNAKLNKFEYRLLELSPDNIRAIGTHNLASWLTKRFPDRNALAKYYFGADLGYSADPSEFVVFEEFNGVMKLVLRVHMEHVTYDIQADIIALMDTHYMFKMLGMDAGSSGMAVAQILQSKRTGWNKFANHRFDKRLLPIPFGGRLEIDRIGGKPITEPAKLAMTNMIIYHAEQRLLQMPGLDYDNTIENQFRNHTYSMGNGGQIVYSKGTTSPDHVIDACRTAFYAKTASSFNLKRGLPKGSTARARQW